VDAHCILQNTIIRYGGSSGSAVLLAGASPQIVGNDISRNRDGIEITASSSPEVTGNCIHGNTEAGIRVQSSMPRIRNNNIVGNRIGVENVTRTICVDAVENWWGCMTGPFAAPSANPDTCALTGNESDGELVSENVDYRDWLEASLPCPVGSVPFYRGDASGDGIVNLADAIAILGYLFSSGCEPACLESGDIDDDGRINIGDAIYLLGYLFIQGPPPAPPGPAGLDQPCGQDAPDSPSFLGCLSYERCL
jgi:parallel beta-helix repeat protein